LCIERSFSPTPEAIRRLVEVVLKARRSAMRQFTTAQYAAVISTIAFVVSCGSLYISKRSYDLSAAKEERELRDKMPAIDVQIRPDGVAAASATISIINRADINIAPLDING
jgi:hypothetical protein